MLAYTECVIAPKEQLRKEGAQSFVILQKVPGPKAAGDALSDSMRTMSRAPKPSLSLSALIKLSPKAVECCRAGSIYGSQVQLRFNVCIYISASSVMRLR